MILLDTHAVIWWTLQPDRLSPAAAAACTRIPAEGGAISSISIWEIGLKMQAGLNVGTSLARYVQTLQKITSFSIIPVDEKIWIKNLELDWPHRDPADRTIVATALLLHLPLVTKDQLIRAYPSVSTLW